MTSFTEHNAWYSVQSTAPNSTLGSSINFSAAAVNSGLAFLQWPHPLDREKVLLTNI